MVTFHEFHALRASNAFFENVSDFGVNLMQLHAQTREPHIDLGQLGLRLLSDSRAGSRRVKHQGGVLRHFGR